MASLGADGARWVSWVAFPEVSRLDEPHLQPEGAEMTVVGSNAAVAIR